MGHRSGCVFTQMYALWLFRNRPMTPPLRFFLNLVYDEQPAPIPSLPDRPNRRHRNRIIDPSSLLRTRIVAVPLLFVHRKPKETKTAQIRQCTATTSELSHSMVQKRRPTKPSRIIVTTAGLVPILRFGWFCSTDGKVPHPFLELASHQRDQSKSQTIDT